jgi:hypothetical protein
MALTVSSGRAQLPLTPDTVRLFGGAVEHNFHARPLSCHAEPTKPFLDFSFRFEAGYIVRCALNQFAGKETRLASMLRITPRGGKPVHLGEAFSIPAMPDSAAGKLDVKRLHAEVEFSGVFAAGAGEYDVDLAVFDNRRLFRKTWRVKAQAHGSESQAPIALAPGSVSSISIPTWQGTSENGTGLRLTVLLDAVPMNPRSLGLRAWDRAFLLGALSSLLRQSPLASVRLVAFNLDQQQEVFRDEAFDRAGVYRLAAALSKLELGTISYKTLQRDGGWVQLLAKLVRDESEGAARSDAVVFVGPSQRFSGQISRELLPEHLPATPLFFYFEYFPILGAEFPDAIQLLTSACNGITFKLHSPGDLAQALVKMRKTMATIVPPADTASEKRGAGSAANYQFKPSFH